jgi:1-acyl-sn-glycerol-3-phosphate acyltransferase
MSVHSLPNNISLPYFKSCFSYYTNPNTQPHQTKPTVMLLGAWWKGRSAVHAARRRPGSRCSSAGWRSASWGVRVRAVGTPPRGPGVVVANHSSWLDILALNAQRPVTFLAKSEVAGWPGIGWLARATGTLFVRREARGEAAQQAGAVAERLRAGEWLPALPEGTLDRQPGVSCPSARPCSTAAGARVARRPEHSHPCDPVMGGAARRGSAVPRLVRRGDCFPMPSPCWPPAGTGGFRITWHPPIPVEGRDRKSLARAAEEAVRSAL